MPAGETGLREEEDDRDLSSFLLPFSMCKVCAVDSQLTAFGFHHPFPFPCQYNKGEDLRLSVYSFVVCKSRLAHYFPPSPLWISAYVHLHIWKTSCGKLWMLCFQRGNVWQRLWNVEKEASNFLHKWVKKGTAMLFLTSVSMLVQSTITLFIPLLF